MRPDMREGAHLERLHETSELQNLVVKGGTAGATQPRIAMPGEAIRQVEMRNDPFDQELVLWPDLRRWCIARLLTVQTALSELSATYALRSSGQTHGAHWRRACRHEMRSRGQGENRLAILS
jgi:hypothetical protein